MTKTLTEQWREGTLRGCFYWKLPNGNICSAYTDTMRDIKKVRDSNEVEVLCEVPSYIEYTELVSKTEQLEKKLEIAMETLQKIADYQTDVLLQYWAEGALNKLKEMEDLK